MVQQSRHGRAALPAELRPSRLRRNLATLALVVASSWAAFAVCIVVIGLSGWLAWKLIRVMARIQARDRVPEPPDTLS